MTSLRTTARAVLPLVAHAAARELDGAVGLLLHTSLDVPSFVSQAIGLVDPRRLLVSVLAWTIGGVAAWIALAAMSRGPGLPFREALDRTAGAFGPLYLRPLITVLALVSLAVRPAYPYGFTLPVALSQDWAPAQDVLALAFVLAPYLPRLRLPAPRAWEVGLLAFLGYALLSPAWSRTWEGHPGNEPKTLRMAVALGHGLTLDVEGVSAGMEDLPVRPLGAAAHDAAAVTVSESLRMIRAVAQGPSAVGRDAISATRVTRQTVRGKEGGIFHVLAPGQSLLLAPTLRLDRAINRWAGTPGRLAVTLLATNAIAAWLAAALFLLARDATGRPLLSAAVALFAAAMPPFAFYSYQFYPEMPGALVIAVVLREVLFRRRWTDLGAWCVGLLLGFLPWLHQKFLPVAGVLAVMAVVVAVSQIVRARAVAGLVIPALASAFGFMLYNFAITGSIRPDAVFLAWGPGGVSSARIGQGLLGLLLDARYGLLPYVPLYALAVAGLLLARGPARPLLVGSIPAAVYYVTVASADNWSGAVCNLGRYVMPALPWALALVAVALARVGSHAAARALVLTLAGWTTIVGVMLLRDPHAANDCWVLLARSTFADGNVYIPNLFLRTWADAAPGLAPRILAWTALVVLTAAWLHRVARGRRTAPPATVMAVTVACLLGSGLLLERWPNGRPAPRFHDVVELGSGTTAFVRAGGEWRRDHVELQGGETELIVRSRTPLDALWLTAVGSGRIDGAGTPLVLGPAPRMLVLPLQPLASLTGRRGVQETLYRAQVQARLDAPSQGWLSLPAAP